MANRPRLLPIFAAALVAAGALAPRPAGADWLVLHDGSRVETRGPWKVDGKRILFDLPNGTLSMLRADQVDLDKSAVATAEARAADSGVKPPPEPKKEPVLVLTEKDIPPSTAARVEGEAKLEGEAKTGSEGAAAAGSPLEVISWEKTETPDGTGVDIFGTVRNNSPNLVTTPSVLVSVYDADGGLLATSNGEVNSPQIAAGKTANFRVTFSGLVDFASAKFEARGRGFAQPTEGEGEGEAPQPPNT